MKLFSRVPALFCALVALALASAIAGCERRKQAGVSGRAVLAESAIPEYQRRNRIDRVPQAQEDAMLARWAAITMIASPFTNPMDPKIRTFNEAAIGATVLGALEKNGALAPRLRALDQSMQQAVVMSSIRVVPLFAIQGRTPVTDRDTPQVLTGILCLTLLNFDIAAETRLDETDMAILRATIDVTASEDALKLSVELAPGEHSWRWPEQWAKLVRETLQKPIVVLRQDVMRQALSDWIDRNPHLQVSDSSGKVLYATRLRQP